MLGKGRVGEEQSEKVDDAEDASSEEEDFMSDSFLTGADQNTTREAATTYSEKRRKKLNEARERGKLQDRAEREKEARAIGLSRNLLAEPSIKRSLEDADAKSGQSNKALKMMMAMGYQQGKGLGRSDVTGSDEKEKGIESGADQSGSKSNAIVEPLAIDERWMGAKARAGIGSTLR